MQKQTAHTGIFLTKDIIAALIKLRNPSSHKGNHGHALLVAGSKGKMGAALLSARACLRTGAGLLTVNMPEAGQYILHTALPEAMLMPRDEPIANTDKFAAIGIGPGMGIDEHAAKLLQDILKTHNKSMLLDADALTILSANKELWPRIPKGSVLTPHPAEFDRLFGNSQTDIERKNKALQLSVEYPWIIILKGNRTLITENGESYTNSTGNAGLAKGGSGDVLSGMILALLAQGYEPGKAAIIAVYLHGLAADIAIENQSMESLLATDVIECIGQAFKKLLR